MAATGGSGRRRLARPLVAWWQGTSALVKLVYLALLANGVPAFILLMSAPTRTDDLFVWTIQPTASAHLLGVMYGNALLLVALGMWQPCWGRARVIFVLISVFSVAATIVTFVNLDPFLEHPWFHLAYWLSMYLILCVAAPTALWTRERAHGGRLPVDRPLSPSTRATTGVAALVMGGVGLALLASPDAIGDHWPWELTPLVGRILRVWLVALAAAFAWTLWDGDGARTRPIFVQGVPTGALLALLPLLHSEDVRANPAGELVFYLGLAALLVAVGLCARRRPATASRG